METEEKGYQEQRRRLLVDHANRIKECEEREASALAEKDRAIKQAQDEFEDRLQVRGYLSSDLKQILRFVHLYSL